MNKLQPDLDFQKQERLRREHNYRELNRFAQKGQTVMVGSSLMEQFPINELMGSNGISGIVYNRGLGGYTTTDLLACLDVCVFELEPSRIFINIGHQRHWTAGDDLGNLERNYRKIISLIQKKLPQCKINMLAYYPVADMELPSGLPEGRKPRTLEAVREANRRIQAMAEELGLPFIDLNDAISDDRGYMRQEYAADPIHMWPSAYQEILIRLKPYLEQYD